MPIRMVYYAKSLLAAQAISPIATHFSVVWSDVCLSSVTFVHPA